MSWLALGLATRLSPGRTSATVFLSVVLCGALTSGALARGPFDGTVHRILDRVSSPARGRDGGPTLVNVSVTPDGGSVSALPGSTGNSVTFTVANTGTLSDTYSLNVGCTGAATNCGGGDEMEFLTVPAGHSATVTAAYDAGGLGAGTMTLGVLGMRGNDQGYYNVTVPTYLTVDAAFNNNDNQDMALCASSCFAIAQERSTVPYYSLDQPRSVTLVYRSDRADPRPIVFADVSLQSGAPTLQRYWLQVKVKWASDYVQVPFVNGDTTIKFQITTPAATTVRLAGQIDAGSFGTGVYPMQIVVTAQYATHTEQKVINTRLMVVNWRASPVARGWNIAGTQQLYLQSDGALLVEGSGSAAFFASCGTNCFTTPAGDFSKLRREIQSVSYYNATLQDTSYVRVYPDSTKVQFDYHTGLLRRISRPRELPLDFEYVGGRLEKVFDPFRRYVVCCTGPEHPSYTKLTYGTGGYGLVSIQEPGAGNLPEAGRSTTFQVTDSTLRAVTDPDTVSTNYSYDGARKLTSATDRRGGLTRFLYDSLSWTLRRTEIPGILTAASVGQTQLDTLRTSFRPWQIVHLPTGPTNVTARTALVPDSAVAVVTDAGGHSASFSANRWGQVLRSVDAAGNVTLTTRSGILPVRIQTPWGRVDSMAYNASGFMIYERLAGKSPKFTAWGKWGQIDSVWGGGQPFVRYFRNDSTAQGSVDCTQSGRSSTSKTCFTYDRYGRDSVVEDPGHHLTAYVYDARFGNRERVEELYGAVEGWTYDDFGRVVQDTSSQGAKSGTTYDLMNRVRKTYMLGRVDTTFFGYDEGLLPVRIQDPQGNVYKVRYNPLGWLEREYDPADTAGSFVAHRYDRDGLRTSSTNRRGDLLNTQYDALHRVLSRSRGTTTMANFSYAISSAGQINAAWNGLAADSAFLAPSGWTDSLVTWVGGKRFRTYYRPDSLWRLDTMDVSSTAGIAFTARRYIFFRDYRALQAIRINGVESGVGETDDEHLRNGTNWPDNTSRIEANSGSHRTSQAYFNRPNLANNPYNTTAENLAWFRRYGTDSLARLDQDVRFDGSSNFELRNFKYDDHGRLQRVRFSRTDVTINDTEGMCSNGDGSSAVQGYHCPDRSGYVLAPYASKQFEYDSVGNLVLDSLTAYFIRVRRATYLPGNRLRTWDTDTGYYWYDYDRDGNDTLRLEYRCTKRSDPSTCTQIGDRRYYWSPEGTLDSVVSGGTRIGFDYDAYGQLLRKRRNGAVERHFLWRDGHLLAELDSALAKRVAEYVYEPGIDHPFALVTSPLAGEGAAPVVRYFVQDQVGNVVGLHGSGTQAGVQQTLRYDVWGDSVAASGVLADTSRLRWKGLAWDADTRLYFARSRWYDLDSRRFLSEDPIGLAGGANKYIFGQSDPVNFRDPSGTSICFSNGELTDQDVAAVNTLEQHTGVDLKFSRQGDKWCAASSSDFRITRQSDELYLAQTWLFGIVTSPQEITLDYGQWAFVTRSRVPVLWVSDARQAVNYTPYSSCSGVLHWIQSFRPISMWRSRTMSGEAATHHEIGHAYGWVKQNPRFGAEDPTSPSFLAENFYHRAMNEPVRCDYDP